MVIALVRMEPVYMDPNTEFDNEFILVQVSTHRVPYRDHQVKWPQYTNQIQLLHSIELKSGNLNLNLNLNLN